MNSYISLFVIAALVGLSTNALDKITFDASKNYECKTPSPNMDGKDLKCFEEITDNSINYGIIYSKCPKGSKCVGTTSDIDELGGYRCVKDTKKVKIGKKCQIDEDCIAGYCDDDGKCSVKESEDYNCNSGKINKFDCRFDQDCVTTPGKIPTCKSKNLKKIGEVCNDDADCPLYSFCFDNAGKKVCTEWGKLAVGTAVPSNTDEKICESGIIEDGKCAELEYVNDCKKSFEFPIGKCSGGPYCAAYKYSSGAEQTKPCKLGYAPPGMVSEYVKPVSKAKQEIWRKFIKELKDFDIEKYKDDKYYEYKDITRFFGKESLREKYFKYEKADDLYQYGYINEKGKVRFDRKCVYDFFFKNSGSFLKSSTLLSLLIIGLLL